MAICSCGLPAHCCQPAVAGSFIYADLWGKLSTHLAPQALFTQSSPVCEPLLQAFPFPSTLREVTLHPLSQACMFVYSSCGKWVFPLSYGVFLPPPLSQAFPLLVAGHAPLLLPSPARPGLFIYSSVRNSPPPFFGAQGPPPSLLCVFIVLIAYYSVSLCSLGGGRSVQAAMLIWPRVVCGSTAYHLAHLVFCVFPSCLVMDIWHWPGALLVSPFNMKWRCFCAGWRCGGVKVLPLLSGLACKVCLQHLSKISL
jgi:hypothetical protein